MSVLRGRQFKSGRAFFAWFEAEYMYKRGFCKTKKNHDIITYAHANTRVIAKGMSTKYTKGTKNANHGAPLQALAHS